MTKLRERILQAIDCCPDDPPEDCDTGCYVCIKGELLNLLDEKLTEIKNLEPDHNSWNFEHDSGWKDCKKAVLKVLR